MDKVECDYCNETEGLDRVGGDIICPKCRDKRLNLNPVPKHILKKANIGLDIIDPQQILRRSHEIDSSVRVRTDIFNANTTAIVELKEAIDRDDSITNKPYALATELTVRYNRHKEVIFELNKQIMDAQTEQRAIQTYLNTLARTLRESEREALKLQDAQYNPGPVKTITVKQITQTKKKYPDKEIREMCVKMGIEGIPLPETTVRMMLISKQMTLGTACETVRKMLMAAKEQSIKPTTEVTTDAQTNGN